FRTPDMRYIAFQRYLSETRDISPVPSLGGAERHLAPLTPRRNSNNGLSWSPDGKSLAAIDQASDHNDGIVLIAVDTGEAHMIAKPPYEIFGYTSPVFSPDGKWIAFDAKQNGLSHDVFVQEIGATRA